MTVENVDMFQQLRLFVRSRIPVTWLVTSEESRAERGISAYAKHLEWEDQKSLLGVWSLTGGDTQTGGWSELPGWQGPALPESFQPSDELGKKMAATPHGGILVALNWAIGHPTHPAVLIIRDAHNFMKNDYWRRALKDCESKLRQTLTSIVCLSVTDQVDDDIKANLKFIRPGLPSFSALQKILKPSIEKLEIKASCYDCATALKGLTSQQALDVLTLESAKSNGNVSVERLGKQKAKELASVHGITFEGHSDTLKNIGGFDEIKGWLDVMKYTFGEQARNMKIDTPKGATLLGVPGNGKTSLARAIAWFFGLPLIIFNPNRCEGGIVGQTAMRVAEAIATMEALSPAVYLIDEVEKIFGGEGNQDGGSKSGMFRDVLIWLEEREGEGFVVATANDAEKLPPEFTRSGRFDEIFWCDLPNQIEREAILSIHLEKRDLQLTKPGITKISKTIDGFTGSEIEYIVQAAQRKAYARFCEKEDTEFKITVADLLSCAKLKTPLSVSYDKKLTRLREWAKTRARPASTPIPEKKPKTKTEEKQGAKKEVPLPGTPLFKDTGTEAW